uniref:Putative secreted protein n=1 Tax=Anopheles marajoara TaxID=58244 RepID=A0A2M4CGS8_9DIPT
MLLSAVPWLPLFFLFSFKALLREALICAGHCCEWSSEKIYPRPPGRVHPSTCDRSILFVLLDEVFL